MWQRLKMVFVDLNVSSGSMAGRVGSVGRRLPQPVESFLRVEQRWRAMMHKMLRIGARRQDHCLGGPDVLCRGQVRSGASKKAENLGSPGLQGSCSAYRKMLSG